MRGRAAITMRLLAIAPLAVAAIAVAPSPARAAPVEDASADRIKTASEEFDKGRRAYLAGDYVEAAIHFENAYHDAPRPEPLRSAIRARMAAHDDARAATLASLASVRYGTDAQTLSLANDTLSETSPKLLGVNLACEPACGVAEAGRVVSVLDAKQHVFYVAPGRHELVVSWPGDRTRRIAVEGGAGSVRNVELDAPPAIASIAPAAPVAPGGVAHPTVEARVEPRRRPLGPAVFLVGAGLTAAGVAATIVSGIAAKNDPGADAVRRDCVGLGTSCATYQRGKSAELRTDLILAGTGALGLATAVIGVFFTQWTRPASSASSPMTPYASGAPGGFDLGLRGTF